MLAFAQSPEYSAVIANEVTIAMAYHAMLGRSAEPEGFAFWVDYMDAGNPPNALFDQFLRSQEYHDRFLP